MTDAELRAAERVRRHAGQLGNAEIADRNTLVLAWLREHQADDGEAVTAEWLKAVGFVVMTPYRDGDDTVLVSPEGVTGHNLFWSENSDGWDNHTWHYGTDYLHSQTMPDQPTRGHVRRLCAALGITLQEPKQ